MKKIWVLSLALVVTAIVAFACGGGDDATPTKRPATPTSRPTATSPAPTATSPAIVGPTATTTATSGGSSVTLTIGGSDDLTFNKNSLTAKAGAAVALTFTNSGIAQSHNWTLVKNGTKDAVATAGVAYSANDWVSPTDTNVVTHTKIIAAGKSDQITFTAPAAGTYQFVCTFPGHNLTMFGTFTVTP